MIPFDVTIHMIVKNEDIFVGYALKSVLPYVKAVIIYDTGSVDKTVSIIKDQILNIKKQNPEIDIKFEQHQIESAKEIANLRQEQLKQTNTDWILLVDGDEIWPEKQLLLLLQLSEKLANDKIAVVNKTRNCVGDIYHYLPDKMGKYSFLGKTGHFNIRLMRKLNYQIKGIYPNEVYTLNGVNVNNLDEKLLNSKSWYLHTCHLSRSSQAGKAFGRRKTVYAKGLNMPQLELPEVMQNTNWPKRNSGFEIRARVYDFGRRLKQIF